MSVYRSLLELVPSQLRSRATHKLQEMVMRVAREEAFLVSREVARAEARWFMEQVSHPLSGKDEGPSSPPAGSDERAVAWQFQYGRLLERMMGPEPWAIDHMEILDDRVRIQGWALPFRSDPSTVGFCLNGVPFEEVAYGGDRSDIARMFWFRPMARSSAFSCETRLPIPGRRPSPWVLSYVHRDTLLPVFAEHACYYPRKVDALPLPDAARRMRSHGADSESSFRLEGFSAFCKLDQALSRFTGRAFGDFSAILDWGCGCGRITRYFGDTAGRSVTGIDIDGDNIEWCRDHLPFGRFHVVDTAPPTTLPDAAFDLILGISVFTHLGEDDQLRWLHELHRIAAPGALLLLTVLGDAGVARGRLSLEEFAEFQERGIAAPRRNPDMRGVVADPGYYRNTFHSYRYLRDVWGRHFRFRGYIPASIGNMQDLAILERV